MKDFLIIIFAALLITIMIHFGCGLGKPIEGRIWKVYQGGKIIKEFCGAPWYISHVDDVIYYEVTNTSCYPFIRQ